MHTEPWQLCLQPLRNKFFEHFKLSWNCSCTQLHYHTITDWLLSYNKKHLKNVGPIRHCEPPHAHSPGVATVARAHRCPRRHDDYDNTWKRGPLWPHGTGPINSYKSNLMYNLVLATWKPCPCHQERKKLSVFTVWSPCTIDANLGCKIYLRFITHKNKKKTHK